MKFAKALIIGAVLSAGAAFAEEERTDPNAIARAELMQTIGKNIGIIGDMAGKDCLIADRHSNIGVGPNRQCAWSRAGRKIAQRLN